METNPLSSCVTETLPERFSPGRTADRVSYTPRMSDDAYCRDLLRKGSRSFYAASAFLPPSFQKDVAALYAFCRVADDAVDLGTDPAAALRQIETRLSRIYRDPDLEDPVDRAFRGVVLRHRIPEEVPRALLEGFEWDISDRRYESLDDVAAYSVRVASTVGVMVTLIMGSRSGGRPSPIVLARAADLGIAMQLTNICRDVGEDARNGRVYLPNAWLKEEGLSREGLLEDPRFTPALGRVVQRLIAAAEEYYRRGEKGIPHLPFAGRLAVQAARLMYADIHSEIAGAGYDSVTHRAYTGAVRKAWMAFQALPVLIARPAALDEEPCPAALALIQDCTPPDRLIP